MTQRRGLGRGLGALIPTGGVRLLDPPDADALAAPAIVTPGVTDAALAVDARPTGVSSPAGAEGADDQGAPDESAERPPDPALPEAPTQQPPPQLEYRELPVDAVVPNPRQPRRTFDDESIAELVHSIRTVGLLQPVVVRPSGAGFELVAGERRLRATRAAGLDTIPALVRQTDDDEMLRDALLENLHRVQLNPLEEAAAYQQLMADFACTQEDLAQRVGRSRPQVANMLRLLKLPPPVQRRVAAGVLSAGHARAILGASSADQMEALATRVVAEGLSVRAVEELVMLADGDANPKPKRRSRARGQTPVEYREAADRLAERLETRVTIDPGTSKGKITIQFAGVEDLARLMDVLCPEAPTG